MLVMPDTVVVADVSGVHPAAPTYAAGAAVTDGAAARVRAKRAHYAQAGVGEPYDLVPLSVESFGRLGKPAMGLLNALADVAVSGGGGPKERVCDERTPAAQRRTVQGQRANVWGV
jgi:hypothetical protein